MITFKQFLLEKKMAPSAYASMFRRLENNARIGFEIEVFIPSGNTFHADPDSHISNAVELKDIQNWIDITTYFDVTGLQEKEIMSDFGRWKLDMEEDWVESNWEDFVDDEDSRSAERDARARALKHATNRFTFKQWQTHKFDGLADFIEQYELEPSFGWATDTSVFAASSSGSYRSGFKNTATKLAEHLSKVLKSKVMVNGTGYSFWNLTMDISIKDSEGRTEDEDQDGYGVEIVSPPLPPSKALEQLGQVFDVLQKYEIQTNESTGIHVNISLENMEQFDPLKLVLFMGDEHILKKFNRVGNSFTNSQYKRVIDSISATGKLPRSADELMKIGKEGLKDTAKYFSVNLLHLPKYLEFRAAGGEDYHNRLHDIREVTGRWLTAVEIASNPDLHRREYLKKIMKLIDKTSTAEEITSFKNASFEQLLLKSEGKMALDNLNDALENGDADDKRGAVLLVLLTLSHYIDKIEPTLSNLKEFRQMFRDADTTPSRVLSDLDPHSEQLALEVLRKFKLQRKPS